MICWAGVCLLRPPLLFKLLVAQGGSLTGTAGWRAMPLANSPHLQPIYQIILAEAPVASVYLVQVRAVILVKVQ